MLDTLPPLLLTLGIRYANFGWYHTALVHSCVLLEKKESLFIVGIGDV